MSAPFEVHEVGVRAMGDEYEAVSARVSGRIATHVVDRGHGEPLARLLLSAPIVAAARKLVVALDRGETSARLRAHLDAVHVLQQAIAEVDAAPLGHIVVDAATAPGPAPRLVRQNLRPGEAIERAVNELYVGNPEGNSGQSMFRAVAVVGIVLVAHPDGPRPAPFAMSAVDEGSRECYRPLSAELREMADSLDRQYVGAELARAGVIVRTCRVCGCTDDDCSGCVAKTGAPCHWVEADLCSACTGARP